MSNDEIPPVQTPIETRPGWSTLVEAACDVLRPERRNAGEETPIAEITTEAGRLAIRIDGACAKERGTADAARTLSGEICEVCGRPGDPVEGIDGIPGCRCRACRSSDDQVLERAWPVEAGLDHSHLISPGQWTQDIRGPGVGADWDAADWRNYGRLETLYAIPIARLMRADNDAEAMRLWAGGPGWAPLLRALFIALRSEQDERPEDPDHVPFRLRWTKEKWGRLNVRTTRTTPYQKGVIRLVETMSRRTCVRCGAPGELRASRWVRPEFDACWATSAQIDGAKLSAQSQ